MPFDSLPQTELTLARLAVVLRDRSMWPEGFRWDYGECVSCAMGLAYQLKRGNRLLFRGYDAVQKMREIIEDAHDMPIDEFAPIFFHLADTPEGCADITPEHVASAIESHLARK